jgi:hypothetical protein
VDHEIEDDVYVQCSRSENTQPVYLKKKRLTENRANGSNRGIEAFEVSDLNDALMTLCQRDQVVCLLECFGERLFDQDVDTS